MRHTQNYGNALLKRIKELMNRSVILSRDNKSFLHGTISSIFQYIRNLFSYKPFTIMNEHGRILKNDVQESFKNSISFYANNPMLISDKEKDFRQKKEEKSSKSGKSVKDVFSFSDEISPLGGYAMTSLQLEKCMRFVACHDSENSSRELCIVLVDIVVKICTLKTPLINTNSSGNLAGLNSAGIGAGSSSGNNSGFPPFPPTSQSNSTTNINANGNNSNNTNNNKNGNTNNNSNNNNNNTPNAQNQNTQNQTQKQKLKAWDNMLASEKFLVDEICGFLGDLGGGSKVLAEKLELPLGGIVAQYWRVCDGRI